MRIIQALFFLFTVVQGFVPTAFVGQRIISNNNICFMTADSHQAKDFTAGSGVDVDHIPMLIKNLSTDNFEESLEMLEPLLTNECVGDVCDDFMSELKDKAAAIGKEIPAGFAPSHH